MILSSLYLTDGRLVYTLDDPYIALKLANVVLGGGYGINASEHCSPSSSILYPLMLAVTQRLGPGVRGSWMRCGGKLCLPSAQYR